MKGDNFKVLYALSFAWQLGFLVLIDMGIFAFLGFLADKFFHTKPLFLLLGFALGPIVAAFQIYTGLNPLIKGSNKK